MKIVIAIAFVAGLIAGTFINLTPMSLHAQSPLSCEVARSYGSVKTAVSADLVFEASDGTIRFFKAADCSIVQVISRY